MALTKAQVREILSEAGVDGDHMKDAVEKIINGHIASIDVLREEADTHKEKAEKLSAVQKELDELKAAGDGGLSVLQEKYNTLEKDHKRLVKEYDQYKSDQTAKETHNAKAAAYRAVLKKANISERHMDTIVRAAKADGVIDGIELDENGAAKNANALEESVKTEWADFVSYTTTEGAQISRPLAVAAGNKHTMTIQEIDNIKDTGARQAAMAQNLDLYGIK